MKTLFETSYGLSRSFTHTTSISLFCSRSCLNPTGVETRIA